RTSNARAFGRYAIDRLRAEVVLLHHTRGFFLLESRFHFLLERLRRFRSGSFARALSAQLHLVSDLAIRVQHVMRARNGITDRDDRVRLARSLQRSEARKRHLVTGPSLAVSIQRTRRRPMNRGAVLQNL